MRIVFFTETFLPKIDGIVNTLCHLFDYLARQGHQTLLFAPEGSPARYAQTKVIGLPGLPFPLYPELKLVSPALDVTVPIRAFQPDLIHVVNPFLLGVSGIRAAKKLEIPLVASYHTDIPGFAKRWGFGMLYDPFVMYLRRLHNQADLNLCPTRVVQQQLIEQGFERVKIWSRGVDTRLFHPVRRSQAWRERLGAANSNTPLLLYVGRLSPEKRVDWLRPVLAALPEAHLAIVGDGPARPELERLFAGTAATFTGYLRHEELANAYAAADVFTFPAANETLGNVVLEAMASGLPVVAARSGGVLDHVVEGKTGLLFEPESVDDLISQTTKLYRNKFLAGALGSAGRKAVEYRSWSAIFEVLLQDYSDVIYQPVPAHLAA
ncbi:MAG: glycosyltransferase family 1 protein [Anaerolineae bacterium]